MTSPVTWIRSHSDPSTRLGEVLFGLIMSLGFTGAVRLGLEEPNNRELFTAILGCNIAWGIVDGVMYAMTELFERGRKARVIRDVLNAPNADGALRYIREEVDFPLLALASPEERAQINQLVLRILQREKPVQAGLQLEDVLGGIAVAILIVVSTLPVVVPYLLIGHADTAVRVSNFVALGMLFALGSWWGRLAGTSPWRMGLGLAVVGTLLVLVTLALGG